MATAQDLITAALRRARCIGRDQVPNAEESADGLAELNRMLEEWSIEGLTVFRIQQDNFPLVAGQASRTIGPTGNFVTARPIKLLAGCFVRRNGVDTGVTVIEDRTRFDSWPVKTLQGLVQAVFYDPTGTNGTLYFKPVPDAADTIFLNQPAQLGSIAALVTALTFPPGYNSLVLNGLAVRLAPEFGMEAPASVLRALGRITRLIKRSNTKSIIMDVDPALRLRGGYVDIRNFDG